MSPGDVALFGFPHASQACAVGAGSDTGNAALGVSGVLGHALNLGEPVRVADDGRAYRVLHVEVLEMLLDIGRRLAKRGSLLGTLCLPAEADVLGEPGGVIADGSALIYVEQDLGNAGPPSSRVGGGVAEGDDRAFGLREKLVLGSLRTVSARDATEELATLLEKTVRVLGKERILGLRDREAVAVEDELTPETDAQCEDITLRDDNTVQVGL